MSASEDKQPAVQAPAQEDPAPQRVPGTAQSPATAGATATGAAEQGPVAEAAPAPGSGPDSTAPESVDETAIQPTPAPGEPASGEPVPGEPVPGEPASGQPAPDLPTAAAAKDSGAARVFRARHLVAACAGAALLAGVIGGVLGSWSSGADVPLSPWSAGSGGTSGPLAAGPVPQVAGEALRSTVTIEASCPGVRIVGTGFFFDSSGHILTNAHVVEPGGHAGKLTVAFSDGSTFRASVVGVAKGYDIAVVKLDGKHRTPAPLPLGNSDQAVIGQPVVAAGAPFDLAGTVTSGIISALHRPVTTRNGTASAYLSALQTDAPINPGNSGGPLLDDAGRVIGVNSAIDSATSPGAGPAGSVGVGFAIPINQAKWVADSLVDHGRAQYAQLGFKVNGAYTGRGVQIGPDPRTDGGPSVIPDGPAGRAGLKPGDVIDRLDGLDIDNGPALISAVWSHRPHDRVEVEYLRDGRTHTVMVVLGARSGSS